MAISIRVAVARVREASGLKAFVDRCKHRLDLLIDHVLEPLLIPVTGGALVALIVFGFVFPMLGRRIAFGRGAPGPAHQPDAAGTAADAGGIPSAGAG